jgi:hypothetical protein
MDYETTTTRSGRCVKHNQSYVDKYAVKKKQREIIEQLKGILGKSNDERTEDEALFMSRNSELVMRIEETRRVREQTQLHLTVQVDEDSLVELKAEQLANMIKSSKFCIVYTGIESILLCSCEFQFFSIKLFV